MNQSELLQLASHVLIVTGSFILYRTTVRMARVWSEMRAELAELRKPGRPAIRDKPVQSHEDGSFGEMLAREMIDRRRREEAAFASLRLDTDPLS